MNKIWKLTLLHKNSSAILSPIWLIAIITSVSRNSHTHKHNSNIDLQSLSICNTIKDIVRLQKVAPIYHRPSMTSCPNIHNYLKSNLFPLKKKDSKINTLS
ncbi:hypothetical protein EGW08_017490 [Elysia chlorotica]|uniref:Uncharacterized protein n=1 Tax=Elysia chlorotica TaxID=188477 RepID=A0A433SZM5_ELYCH|nr:hypothetical protein EGW08_017490 [Elysia chlorotica]